MDAVAALPAQHVVVRALVYAHMHMCLSVCIALLYFEPYTIHIQWTCLLSSFASVYVSVSACYVYIFCTIFCVFNGCSCICIVCFCHYTLSFMLVSVSLLSFRHHSYIQWMGYSAHCYSTSFLFAPVFKCASQNQQKKFINELNHNYG